jgi:hypothetical protein
MRLSPGKRVPAQWYGWASKPQTEPTSEEKATWNWTAMSPPLEWPFDITRPGATLRRGSCMPRSLPLYAGQSLALSTPDVALLSPATPAQLVFK